MNPLPLPGLVGSQPLCALAAFGLLRICSYTPQLGRVGLGWDLTATPSAVLWFEQPVSGDGLIRETLLPWMSGRWECRVFGSGEPGQKGSGEEGADGIAPAEGDRGSPSKAERNRGKALRWDNDIKVSRETLAKELQQARIAAACTCRRDVDHLVGYATDAREVKSSTRGKVVATTSLCMTAGNQAILKLLRDLAFSLNPGGEWSRRLSKEKVARIDPATAFRQALLADWDFAPGNVRDEGFLPLGWDAESYYVAALQGQATPNLTPPRAAIWLAAEAMPLFPCTAISRGRAQTRGFDLRGGVFRWPIWCQPLSLRAVQAALGLPALYEKTVNPEVIRVFGIDQVYGSGIIALTDYKSFRPPTLLADARQDLATNSEGTDSQNV